MNSDSHIICIVGMRGCGKSTLTRLLSEQPRFDRKIVFDIVEEWDGTHVANSSEEFANLWREVFALPAYTIVVRFPFGATPESMQTTTDEISKLVYFTGRDSGLETCMIFEEAQYYFPSNALTPTMMGLITTGRHAKVNIIANTQRPASIAKLLISQAEKIYIGKLYEKNDMDYLKDCVGKLVYEARSLPALHFIYYEAGRPEDAHIIDAS